MIAIAIAGRGTFRVIGSYLRRVATLQLARRCRDVGRPRWALLGLGLLGACGGEIEAPPPSGVECELDQDCAASTCGTLIACVRGRCQVLAEPGEALLKPCWDGGLGLLDNNLGADRGGIDGGTRPR